MVTSVAFPAFLLGHDPGMRVIVVSYGTSSNSLEISAQWGAAYDKLIRNFYKQARGMRDDDGAADEGDGSDFSPLTNSNRLRYRSIMLSNRSAIASSLSK
jgi:hypothetical protein